MFTSFFGYAYLIHWKHQTTHFKHICLITLCGTFGFNQVAIRATRMITSAQPKIGNTHAAHARIAPKTSSGAASGGPGELYASNQQRGSATLVFMAWGAILFVQDAMINCSFFGWSCGCGFGFLPWDHATLQMRLSWNSLTLGMQHAHRKLAVSISNSQSSLEPEFHELIF